LGTHNKQNWFTNGDVALCDLEPILMGSDEAEMDTRPVWSTDSQENNEDKG